jgi:trans-aconitate 2-methyltransferase
MGRKVVERLPLRGDETVLDAGCGTGKVTRMLLDRLPRGRVVAIDADPDMVEKAAASLGDAGGRLVVRKADLLAMDAVDEFDAVLSTATFHWILDHDLLFANLFRALRAGGRLVAQCGGAGNIAAVLAAGDVVGREGPWSDRFAGWKRPSLYATAEETEARLVAAGFRDVNCWLEPAPVVPEDPHEYLATVNLGAHIQRLDAGDRAAFIECVVARLPQPVTVDYIRLDMEATKPS